MVWLIMKYLTSIMGNSQKLDGGAMFGHVPKSVWSKWLKPDDKNRVSLACRALLIQDGNKNILLETGVGAFFEPTLRERYGIEEEQHILLESLKKVGLSDIDIDFVILSHLHFDHAGGLLSSWKENNKPALLFPKARFLVSKEAWRRSCKPHTRDRASFIPQLHELLENSNRLVIIDEEYCDLLGDDYQFWFTQGHTPGLMHTVVNLPHGPVIFASDLIPGSHWVHLPIGMGYDRLAELLLDEKEEMLTWAVQHHARLFFTHDPSIAIASVIQDTSGKYMLENEVKDFVRLAV